MDSPTNPSFATVSHGPQSFLAAPPSPPNATFSAADLRTFISRQHLSSDATNERTPAAPWSDNHLGSTMERPKHLPLRTADRGCDFGERSHVKGTADSVDNVSWTEQQESPPPRTKNVLAKSHTVTCGNFSCNCGETHSQPIPIKRPTDRVLQRKKLFASFSHPDTSFVFTEEELRSPQLGTPSPTASRRINWRRKDPECELPWPLGNSRESLVRSSRKKISVLRSYCSEEIEEKGGFTPDSPNNSYTIIPVHPEISIKVRSEPESGGVNQGGQLKIDKTSGLSSANEDKQASQPPNNTRDNAETLKAAQKFFEESGILGPAVAMGNSLFRKSSKVHIIDNLQFEQIRKHSKTVLRLDNPKSPAQNSEVSSASTVAVKSGTGEEISNLRELLKLRDNEIVKLKREIHKLKSVLQQTSEAPIEAELISRITTPTHLARDNGQHEKDVLPAVAATNHLATKKQGVSAESSENKQQMLKDFTIAIHEKDFKSKQLIKDAILDNDFLKHLSSGQIKELVESMYRKEIKKGEYVIREGDSGAHLYISDEGEFEVIKDEVILGRMGPGKAFGELAILYNCKRTASIRVLVDSKVWVLDRKVFQQIMIRTGMQRIEENIAFLRSVPLLKNLGVDSLAKIADVLEVEFYPTGTYIIRQDTSGDSFFLISQGSVAVTQRLPGTKIEEEVRVLRKGDYFGEQALIKEDKRTANIIALSPGVECLTLDRESFRKFIGELSELHNIDYGDQDRVTSFRENEREVLRFSKAQNQTMLHVNLNDLEVVATLGVGGFGRVELVRHCGESNDRRTFALKCLKKQHIVDTQQEEHVFNERSIMMSCDSKFICRLYRTYRDEKFVYLLMEACLGGEVWTILRNRGNFDEFSAQFIIGCVLEAFQYLHTRGIVFRDLKPENLLLDANGYVKLIDFGFAKFIGFSSKTWTFCGTPEYVAPEVILNKGHDRAVDYWALGILVFELLTGAPPFTSADPMKTYNIILKNMMEFPSQMSKTAIAFIKSLCKDIPAERLGYQRGGVPEIKKHKWFQGFDWDELSSQTMPSPIKNPVENDLDTSNFDYFPDDLEIPPDEFSGWDADF